MGILADLAATIRAVSNIWYAIVVLINGIVPYVLQRSISVSDLICRLFPCIFCVKCLVTNDINPVGIDFNVLSAQRVPFSYVQTGASIVDINWKPYLTLGIGKLSISNRTPFAKMYWVGVLMRRRPKALPGL